MNHPNYPQTYKNSTDNNVWVEEVDVRCQPLEVQTIPEIIIMLSFIPYDLKQPSFRKFLPLSGSKKNAKNVDAESFIVQQFE